MGTNIREIQKQLQNIASMLDEIEEKSVTSSKQSVIDFTKMQNLGYRNRFVDHWTYKLDSDIRHDYEVLLCAMISLAENQENKICQYYFLTRVMDKKDSLQETIQDAGVSIDEKLDILAEEFTSDQIKLVMFDLLLMISMKGNLEEKQLDYFCELQSYFSVDKKQMEAIFRATSCVLKQNTSEIFECAKDFPIKSIVCYLPIKMDYDIVTSIRKLDTVRSDSVVAFGIEFNNMEINIDDYHVKEIKFLKCTFQNCSKIYANIVGTEFEQCIFDSCCKKNSEEAVFVDFEIDNEKACGMQDGFVKLKDICTSIIEIDRGRFENCRFINCQNLNNALCSSILRINKGDIQHCNFDGCRVEAQVVYYDYGGERYNFASVLYGKNLHIKDTSFNSCISFGNGVHSNTVKGDIYGAENQYLHIVFLDNGSIEQSNFSQCICDGVEVVCMKQYNYLINEKNVMIKEVTYSNCKATENVGTAKWRIDDDR